MRFQRLLRALAAHGPAQRLGLAVREARQRLADLEHLVLVDDRRPASRRALRGGADEGRGSRSRDSPGASRGGARRGSPHRPRSGRGARSPPGRPGPRGSGDGCAGASGSARGSRPGRAPRCRRRRCGRRSASSSKSMRERSGASPCRSAIRSTAVFDQGEHAQRQEVDLDEARVLAASPCPTGRAPGPPRRAGSSGTISTRGRLEMIMPPTCCEMWRGRPETSSASSPSSCQSGASARSLNSGSEAISSASARGGAVLGQLGQLLELAQGQVERLADLAHGGPEPVGREGAHEPRVLVAVALVDPAG